MSGRAAMVTYEGERVLAVQNSDGWAFHDVRKEDDGMISVRWADGSCFTDITPLVCLELTREDADVLDSTRGHLDDVWRGSHELLANIAQAIREQTPAPLVIPERLGAVVEDAEGHRYVRAVLPMDPSLGEAACWTRADEYGPSRHWYLASQIKAVRVLSEGVS